MQDETMIVLAEYNTITEAEIAKSMLDSAGIWATIRNEYMSAIYPIGTMPAQVVVREEDYEKKARPPCCTTGRRTAATPRMPPLRNPLRQGRFAFVFVRERSAPEASVAFSRSCSGIRKRSAEVRHL